MEARAGDARRRGTPNGCHGFTLAELLSVVVIMAVVGGLGAGAFFTARRNYSLHGSAGELQGVIRAARNSALTTGSPSFVEIQPADRVVRAFVFESVGEWNFDAEGTEDGLETSRSGFRMERQEVVAAEVVEGKIGSALDFRPTGAHVRVEPNSQLDLRACVQIEAWVKHFNERSIPRPASSQKKRRGLRSTGRLSEGGSESADLSSVSTIVSKRGAYALSMTASGRLVGSIGGFDVMTTDRVVGPGRWVFVSMRFDGLEVTLAADGVPRTVTNPYASGEEEPRAPRLVPITPHALFISSPESEFPGWIDEVRVSGTVEPEEYRYPEFEHIVGWQKFIYFDRRGHLDRTRHDEPFHLTLLEIPDRKGGRNTSVMVDYSVTFEEWARQWENPPADLSAAGEEAKILARYQDPRSVTVTVGRLGDISVKISGRGS